MSFSGNLKPPGGTVVRGTDRKLSPQELLRDVCDFRLDWPGKTVRLERNSVLDYRQRSASAQMSVAELYHENSKLFPNMVGELAARRVDVEEFRREFIKRRAALPPISAQANINALSRSLLTAVSASVHAELFYALELRVAAENLLTVHEPKTDTLQVIKKLSPEDLLVLKGALQVANNLQFAAPSSMLFLVASFARNDVLFGPRGYRRTLLEAGQVAAGLLAEAERIGISAQPVFEFVDREIDVVMEADGIEEGVVSAIVLGDVANAE